MAIQIAGKSGYRRLETNALHIRAQIFARDGDLVASNGDLMRAKESAGELSTPDLRLIERQLSFNEATRLMSLKPLNKIAKAFLRERSFENLREADFQSLSIRFREALFNRLFWGTPLAAYRRRLRSAFPDAKPSSPFVWGPSQAPVLNLASGFIDGKPRGLTKQNTRLLRALISDLYVPPSLGSLFESTFPDLPFDSVSSADRLHQAIRRLRKWARVHGVPLEIRFQSGTYSLTPSRRLAFEIASDADHNEATKSEQTKLIDFVRLSGPCSASRIRAKLLMPKATLTRLIAKALATGHLIVEGRSRATRYSARAVRAEQKCNQSSNLWV